MKRKVFVLLLILGVSTSLYSQPPGGGCGPDSDEMECDDESIPMDDGVAFLLTASMVYGLYHVRGMASKNPGGISEVS